MGIFSGLRVLDAASFIAAPGAATLLSDFGAEVIKIEPPGGDGFRQVYRLPNMPVCEHNFAWELLGRNKRSLVLDLKQAAAREVLHRLVRAADVLITNYPPAVRERLGLAWAQVEALNPRLVYASLTGYGETGPEANKPGFDATTFWARSGLADLVRPEPDSPPASAAPGMGDQPTAGMLFAAIVAALYRREKTGRGGRVATSLLANGAWANGLMIQGALCGGEVVYRQPRHRPRNALTNSYRCRDGRWFLLSLVAEERDWASFVALVEEPALRDDPRFTTLARRREHATELASLLDEAFARRDSAQWQTAFEAAGHTVGVISRAADVLDDAQMRECAAIVEAPALPGGRTVAGPIQIDGEIQATPRRAPGVGEHTDAILAAHGFSAQAIHALREQGAVA